MVCELQHSSITTASKYAAVRYTVVITSEGLDQDGSGCESYDIAGFDADGLGDQPRLDFNDDVDSATRICEGDTAYCESYDKDR